MSTSYATLTLTRRQDRVYAQSNGDEAVPVRVLWARPITGRGREVSVVGLDKKELFLLKSLDCLEPDSRRIAEEELNRRYLVPRITQVRRTSAHFGNRYWDVQTDRGPRRFLMKDPNKNATWITNDRLVIRDSLGNRYEITAFSKLDTTSKIEAERVI